MPECECAKCWCNFASKIYLTINISTLILIYFLQENKFYEDDCFKQRIYYSELAPISEMYSSTYKTDDSIQLGYLEKYSGKYTEISPKGIYKFDNYCTNVKRKNMVGEEIDSPVRIDVKVSYKNELDYIYKRNSNICFSKDCAIKNGYCEIPFIYASYESEVSTNDFILDNDIKISSKDTSEFYDPKIIYKYKIYREANYAQKENRMDMVDTYKQVITSILVLNPLLRIIKIILLSCVTVKYSGNCTLINLFFSIIHAINAALFLLIINFYGKLLEDDVDIDDTLDSIQISLVVLEFFCIIHDSFLFPNVLLDNWQV